ncbi:MAG: GrpB family protein [Nostoc sp. NMS7]|uniref:GrpB family protein n=1 Tax=Nostoc sp. NMS7 TaxID=2815391 RepID=UPI0025DCAB40|nr:GrpB family protein [Nostoc sp. NMS7]MBN3945596.1 GrpB family protein [Nostoc sp. NMS7]
MTEQIIIFDYDTHWPILFEELRVSVAEVLGDLALAIEHVGSTSVPGLPAKPIIDMDVVVKTSAHIPKVSERLATLGYVYEGDKGIRGREAYVWPPNKPRHHLYVCPRDSEALQLHLLFRDYLLKHPNEAQRYGCLKRELALKFTNDIEAYTNAKTTYIQMIVERALKDGCWQC